MIFLHNLAIFQPPFPPHCGHHISVEPQASSSRLSVVIIIIEFRLSVSIHIVGADQENVSGLYKAYTFEKETATLRVIKSVFLQTFRPVIHTNIKMV